jgi:hypothetical protein
VIAGSPAEGWRPPRAASSPTRRGPRSSPTGMPQTRAPGKIWRQCLGACPRRPKGACASSCPARVPGAWGRMLRTSPTRWAATSSRQHKPGPRHRTAGCVPQPATGAKHRTGRSSTRAKDPGRIWPAPARMPGRSRVHPAPHHPSQQLPATPPPDPPILPPRPTPPRPPPAPPRRTLHRLPPAPPRRTLHRTTLALVRFAHHHLRAYCTHPAGQHTHTVPAAHYGHTVPAADYSHTGPAAHCRHTCTCASRTDRPTETQSPFPAR